MKARLKLKEIEIVLDEPAHEFVIEKGYDPTYGARPMRRAVERYLEDPLAEELLKGNVKAGDLVEVTVERREARLSRGRAARQRRRRARAELTICERTSVAPASDLRRWQTSCRYARGCASA